MRERFYYSDLEDICFTYSRPNGEGGSHAIPGRFVDEAVFEEWRLFMDENGPLPKTVNLYSWHRSYPIPIPTVDYISFLEGTLSNKRNDEIEKILCPSGGPPKCLCGSSL